MSDIEANRRILQNAYIDARCNLLSYINALSIDEKSNLIPIELATRIIEFQRAQDALDAVDK